MTAAGEAGERDEVLRRAPEFARLFLFLGVGHCDGGAGPESPEGNTLPFPASKLELIALDPLVQWVEHGAAPDQIIANHAAGNMQDSSRPARPIRHCRVTGGRAIRQKASSFLRVGDSDSDDNQPPDPRYLDDGDNYPIVRIDDGHDHDKH